MNARPGKGRAALLAGAMLALVGTGRAWARLNLGRVSELKDRAMDVPEVGAGSEVPGGVSGNEGVPRPSSDPEGLAAMEKKYPKLMAVLKPKMMKRQTLWTLAAESRRLSFSSYLKWDALIVRIYKENDESSGRPRPDRFYVPPGWEEADEIYIPREELEAQGITTPSPEAPSFDGDHFEWGDINLRYYVVEAVAQAVYQRMREEAR